LLRSSYRKKAKRRIGRLSQRGIWERQYYLPDMGERFIDRAFFGFALVLLEIGLQLFFGLDGVGHEFPLRPERQLADITIRGAGSASNESDDDEFPVRHRANHGRGAAEESNGTERICQGGDEG
jgi:hypothetical protein